MAPRSCITDAPLNERDGEDLKDSDKLKAGKYADALAKFIRNADTPVTIGIQGGWGSGKTSLFSLLRSQLAGNHTMCITVNAWEHSLFQGDNGKSTVVLSLLNGMVDAIGALAQGKNSQLDPHTVKEIRTEVSGANNILKTIRSLLPTVAQVGISLATGIQVATPPKIVPDPEREEVPPVAQQVHELKKKLTSLVRLLPRAAETDVRLVVFIDDLDRVPPPTAVELLDVTKNVFDIGGCVFVLAIDYEVVVKGLEAKFGKPSKDNAREFRQYFDKIIQIPFTMPIGAFSKEINELLKKMLSSIWTRKENGGELEEKTLKALAKTATLATGSIPRSIQRIVNTLSLLEFIEEEKKDAHKEEGVLTPLEVRFIIVALHINFPEICTRLMERLDFTQWTLEKLEEAWDLKYEGENKKRLDALQKSSELSKYFDEDWEKVVYCLCAKSDWLSRNAVNISRILNQLRDILNSLDDASEENEESETDGSGLSEKSIGILKGVMESIRVVSLDNELQTADIDNSAQNQDAVTRFCRKVDEALREQLPALRSAVAPKDISAYEEDGERFYKVRIEGDHLEEFYIEWDPEQESIFPTFSFLRGGQTAKRTNEIIADIIPDDFYKTMKGRGQTGLAEIYTSIDWKKSDFFLNNEAKIQELVQGALDVYGYAVRAQKKIRQSLRD